MGVRSWNYHGILQWTVDAESDLASISNPKSGDVALALAEGSLWFHTGTTWQEIGGGSGGAPTDADYLVGTANGSLSAEIAVGTTPGGELGGTWASPTVDATHSGSAHHAEDHDNTHHTATYITSAGVTFENLDANGDVGTGATQVSQGDHTHAGGSGHTIAENGTPLTARTTLNFVNGLVASDDAGNDETEVRADYGAVGGAIAIGNAADNGAATSVSRSDHTHAFAAPGASYPQDIADTESDGVATTAARSDHVHSGSAYRKEADWFEFVTFTKTGNLSTGTGATRKYNHTGRTLTIQKIAAAVGTAPASQAIIGDVNIDGTTIWSTQGNRVQIAASANLGTQTTFNTTTIADGSYMTTDLDQVGSGTVGADYTLTVWVSA